MFEYQENRLVVDEIIYDPSLYNGIVIMIGGAYYYILNAHTNGKIAETNIRPYHKAVCENWRRAAHNYEYMMHNMIPRSGYKVQVKRAATAEEIDALCAEHNLTPVGEEFDFTVGGIYGVGYAVTIRARQFRVPAPGSAAINLESKLDKLGVQANNSAPNRIVIRTA